MTQKVKAANGNRIIRKYFGKDGNECQPKDAVRVDELELDEDNRVERESTYFTE